jgi:gamma-glutamyltranspeptidase/glutathione hydrolase
MRAPVLAQNVVATSQPLAAQAGLEMLRAGGNAVDAAVAAGIALTVVEPSGTGVGGDAFAMVWDGEELHGLNASGRSPAAWRHERFAHEDVMPEIGWDAVTVPGAVSAWVALSERFGALPFTRLFEPAMRYAREGYLVSPGVANAWTRAVDRLGHRRDFLESFAPGGSAPSRGQRWCMPELAWTLRRIANTNGRAFYEGDLAERIAEHAATQDGALTQADLAAHRAEWVTPLRTRFRDVELLEMPPNGQGLAALIGAGVIERLDEERLSLADADGLHLAAEAMKLGVADVARHVADPDAMQIAPADLLQDVVLARAGESIDREQAWPPDVFPHAQGGTVLVVAADETGRCVSYIQSNYMGFGSGVVVPGTDISLHNRGAGFVTDARHANVVGPSKRPLHTILPAMTMSAGAPDIDGRSGATAGARPAVAARLRRGARAPGGVGPAALSARGRPDAAPRAGLRRRRRGGARATRPRDLRRGPALGVLRRRASAAPPPGWLGGGERRPPRRRRRRVLTW